MMYIKHITNLIYILNGENNMKKNLPTNIKSKASRKTYYMVQNIISDRYEAALSKTTDKETHRRLKEQFNKDIQDTIDYYVNME